MTKDEILKAFYLSQITALLEKCNDPATLDYIYRILADATKQTTTDTTKGE